MDSTVVRAHQHAAGARTAPPPAPKGAGATELQDEKAWRDLLDLLAGVVEQVRRSAARVAVSPRRST